jgi:Na+/H+ antiporter NhaD/arsenite permease-like protein
MIPAVLSSSIFTISLGLILSEKINRTIVAVAGAALMVGVGIMFGFYSEDTALTFIEFNTLGLLLGMMILVALLEPTGFFQYLAVWGGRLSAGRPIRLLVLLGTVTTVASMFLDNVTTVVLIAPVTILISEIMGISPRPLLMAEALLSNTGGVATLVGDPPNILIASAADFSFVDFLVNSLPIVVVVWLVALILISFLFRKELSNPSGNVDAILELHPAEVLQDRQTTKKVLVVIGLAVVLFLFEERLHVRPSFIALSSAALALVWIRPDIQETLKRIEWSVLLFFSALFVMVGGMEAAGVLHAVARLVARVQHLDPVLLGLALLWIVAIFSAIVDNVPMTIALIPVIQELGSTGMDVSHLWWALAFGAGFGGNGTIIGSTANIVVTALSERTREPITSALWNKRGLPVMLITCLVASILYAIVFS